MRFDRFRTVWLCWVMLSLIGHQAASDVVDGSFEKPITDQEQWTAGTDEMGRWYGAGFVNRDGAAATPQLPTQNQNRALVQGIWMPESGRYRLSVSARFTSGPVQQQIYWHVLGVEHGVTLRLTNNGIPRGMNQSGVKSLWLGHVYNHQDQERWFTYSDSFWVSPEDAVRFSHLVIAIVGVRPPGMISEFDNVSTDVPFAVLSSDAGIKVEWYTAPQNISKLDQIEWSTPLMISTERSINWSRRSAAFRAGVPTDSFGLRATGYLDVARAGLYTFDLGSDEGSKLIVDGRTVIEQDQLQSYTRRTSQLELEAGRHPFEIMYFERHGDQGLVLSWRGPGDHSTVVVGPEFYFLNAGGGSTRRVRVVRWRETGTIDE